MNGTQGAVFKRINQRKFNNKINYFSASWDGKLNE